MIKLVAPILIDLVIPYKSEYLLTKRGCFDFAFATIILSSVNTTNLSFMKNKNALVWIMVLNNTGPIYKHTFTVISDTVVYLGIA